jgi:hypothetical protein
MTDAVNDTADPAPPAFVVWGRTSQVWQNIGTADMPGCGPA